MGKIVAANATAVTAAAIAGMLAVAATLAGCMSPHPYIRTGDVNSVEITYAEDLDSTLPLAREFCGRYERTPQLVNHTIDSALYKCIPSPPPR